MPVLTLGSEPGEEASWKTEVAMWSPATVVAGPLLGSVHLRLTKNIPSHLNTFNMGTELQIRAVGEAKTKFALQLQESVELVLEG